MNPPNPDPLTTTGDTALNQARAALNGLTDRQAIETLAALMLTGVTTPAAMTAEAMRVSGFPR